MQFYSTKNPQQKISLSSAIYAGLAADGGLYVPESLPQISIADFNVAWSYAPFAETVLRPFFAGDKLDSSLHDFCKNAFNFPVPLRQLDTNTWVMELFHGPTLSFKDFGARFLAECINALSIKQKTTILVATSGDTGSAVAAAFYQKPNVRVIVLYPKGEISARQEHQITCWQDNVLAIAVRGHFDDCQRLVKSAFQNTAFQASHLSTANSINIGRLLPQMVYYAYWSIQYQHQHGLKPGFIVPSGNLGNITAAYWAKAIGFPIRDIVMSINANTTMLDYAKTGDYKPRSSITTLANAMDVGNPSNFERLKYLLPTFAEFQQAVKVFSVSDHDIANTIQKVYRQTQTILCPHTATAYFAREQLFQEPWIVVATADASKFDTVIEPLIHETVSPAAALQVLLQRETHCVEINADLGDLMRGVSHYFGG